MNLAEKKFRNNRTGDILTIIDSFENIAILEDRSKMKVSDLLDSSLYTPSITGTEEINPISFFENQNSYDVLASKIRSIDTSNIKDDVTGEVYINTGDSFDSISKEPAVILSNEDEEKALLSKKYGIIDNTTMLTKQNEAFASILGDDSELPIIPTKEVAKEDVYRVNVSRIEENRVDMEDPMIKMFKGVKRSLDFKIDIEIGGKIPRLDFIEMMEDSYETSIIDFLANEFTSNIINNPSVLHGKVKSMLNKMVYGEDFIDKVMVDEVNISEPESKPKRKYTRKEKNSN